MSILRWLRSRKQPTPAEWRSRAVRHLKENISTELDKVRHLHAENPEEWWIASHFGFGMGVRNVLREVVKDDELPPLRHFDGRFYSNWDDWYVEVLEEAAGLPVTTTEQIINERERKYGHLG